MSEAKTPFDQWPETVRMLCEGWPDVFTRHYVSATEWQLAEYNEAGHYRIIHINSLDSLAAISEAIGAVTWVTYEAHWQKWTGHYYGAGIGYHHVRRQTAGCCYLMTFPDEITARLAAVNAAVRYVAKQKESEK